MSRGRAPGPGRLWKRGRNWTLDYRDSSGTRRQQSLGANKAVADRRRMEIIRRRDMELDGLGGVEGMNLPLEDVIDEYLADLRPQVTDRHLVNVEGRLRRTIQDLGPKTRVRDLRPVDVRRLMNEKVQDGSAHRTANLIGTTWKSVLKWAAEVGLIAINPLQTLKKLPESREHQKCNRRALTDDEIARFLQASRDDDAKNELQFGRQRVPQTPLWTAMLDTGARWNELRTLVWGDVDFTGGVVALRAANTKNRKPRIIPLTERLSGELGRLRRHHERVLGRLPQVQDRVFLTPRGVGWGRPTNNPMRIFDRVLAAADVARVDVHGEKVDIHALRHTFATRLARAGAELTRTQRLMGHKDPKLTAAIYTHIGVDDLRSAIELLDGEAAGRTDERNAG